MPKMRLRLDDLSVDTFRPVESKDGERGTVHGQQFQTQIQTCGSCGSVCATCQAGGCPGDTLTCYFESCLRTNGYQVCIGHEC